MSNPDTDKNTPDKGNSDPTGDYEKRYKDLQATYTKSQQELTERQRELDEMKKTFDAVTPFVDWDSAMGRKKNPIEKAAIDTTDEPEIDSSPRRKAKTITEDDLNQRLSVMEATTSFRMQNPDLLDKEDLVALFIRKTDPRKPMADRLKTAAQQAREFLESVEKQGIEKEKRRQDEEKRKSAETSGLASMAKMLGRTDEKEEEIDPEKQANEYLAFRKKNASAKKSIYASQQASGKG